MEILVFFAIVAALLLFFCLVYAIQRRRAKREIASRESEILDHRLDELNLSDEQLNLLDRLARHMEKGSSESALLLNHHVFDECARRTRESEDLPAEAIEALRVKIGFHLVEGENAPVSSTELPVGSTLVLVARGKRVMKGALMSQAPRGMTVQMDRGTRRLLPGAPVAVHYYSSLGIFSFMSRVTEAAEDSLTLAHSSALRRHQRRAFHRQDASLPVFAAPAVPAAVQTESLLLNLSAGGASLLRQGLAVKRGDLIMLSFSPHMGGLAIPARVLRITGRDKVLHVRFEAVTETQRKRIILFLRRRVFKPRVVDDDTGR